MKSVAAYLTEQAERLEPVLAELLPAGEGKLEQAMRYAVLGGGKRLRPVLCMAVADANGGDGWSIAPAACSLELIHCYSLVHDDLPAMDDAELRRGQPACHRVFGEAMAILAGDGLLTLAFEVLAQPLPGLSSERRVEAVEVLAAAAGVAGMVGGQALDIVGTGCDPEAFTRMVGLKTGALFQAAVRLGVILSGGPRADAFERYGAAFGLAFQLADDLQDGDGFVELLGERATRARAREAADEAMAAARSLGARAEVLAELARFAVERQV